jgi:hypothetical protein
MAATLLIRNQHILQSIRIITEELHENAVKERASRPHSPVKMLTSLFGGSVSRDNGSLRKLNGHAPIPQMRPPHAPRQTTDPGPVKAATSPTELVSTAADALTKLEETLASYILALDARRGNIVGKILRGRASADELAVNELYNALLEDPANYEIVAQAPIDVLFSAFEKFVKIAWFDKIGPIVSRSTWDAIQSKLDTLYPGDFEEFFRVKFAEMAPQNQRALRACIKLLADLLGGTNNDGDRGVLTVSFAEVLVREGNPNEFVTVLDRLVEDIQALLGEHGASAQPTPHGSMNEGTRARVTNTSSLTSNTSLRKKFGFGTLTRKASKLGHGEESEKTDLASVWRALSKSKHGGDNQTASMSKASGGHIGRPNSTDVNVRLSPKRPVSQDRPTVLGAFPFEQHTALTTIGEAQTTGPPRKKRRSSISDLRSLHTDISANSSPVFNPLRTPNKSEKLFGEKLFSDSPSTPSPIKQSFIPAPSESGTPTRRTLREGSPIRVVPMAGSTTDTSSALPRPLKLNKVLASPKRVDEVTITANSTPPRRHKESNSVSGIPTIKSPPGGLHERPTSGNVRKLPPNPSSPEKTTLGPAFTPSAAPTAKLRMQSPQKLRERLNNEKRAIQDAENALQVELAQITDELKSGSARTVVGRPAHSRTQSTATTGSQDTLHLQSQVQTLQARLAALESDISSSLAVSESRAKKLDELYRDANAENEALYARFNEEITKVIQRVRIGEGEAEVRRRMRDAEDEAGRLRKENARLKRENLGLKAQLRE